MLGANSAAVEELGLAGAPADHAAGFTLLESAEDSWRGWEAAGGVSLNTLSHEQLAGVAAGASDAAEEARARGGAMVGTAPATTALRSRGDALVAALRERARREEAALRRELADAQLRGGALSRLLPPLRNLEGSLRAALKTFAARDGPYASTRATAAAIDAVAAGLASEEAALAAAEAHVEAGGYAADLRAAVAAAEAEARAEVEAAFTARIGARRAEDAALVRATVEGGAAQVREESIAVENAQAADFGGCPSPHASSSHEREDPHPTHTHPPPPTYSTLSRAQISPCPASSTSLVSGCARARR